MHFNGAVAVPAAVPVAGAGAAVAAAGGASSFGFARDLRAGGGQAAPRHLLPPQTPSASQMAGSHEFMDFRMI